MKSRVSNHNCRALIGVLGNMGIVIYIRCWRCGEREWTYGQRGSDRRRPRVLAWAISSSRNPQEDYLAFRPTFPKT